LGLAPEIGDVVVPRDVEADRTIPRKHVGRLIDGAVGDFGGRLQTARLHGVIPIPGRPQTTGALP
jgi:hypothetical protein